MKINTFRLAFSSATAALGLWIVCTAVVVAIPGPVIAVIGYMLHLNLSGLEWHPSIGGFLIGLAGWMFLAGAFSSLLGFCYNSFERKE